ncbi:hypothetical protein MTO96_038438 [Rhipicephalus appendiculatus]
MIGLSQHRRDAHVEGYNADITSQGSKPKWHREEEYLMAVFEVELRRQKVYNLNQKLHTKFPMRIFDAVKSHRRGVDYRKLVDELMAKKVWVQSITMETCLAIQPLKAMIQKISGLLYATS